MYFQKTGKQEQEEKLYEMQEKNVTRQQRKWFHLLQWHLKQGTMIWIKNKQPNVL